MDGASAPLGLAPSLPEVPALRRLHFDVTMAMEADKVFANIEHCMDRNLPDFWKLPEVMKFKGDEPIALVGGGPTLSATLTDLRGFKNVMVCGSSHDYVLSQGVIPRYCAIADPDKIALDYLKNPHPLCTYLIASQCDPALFDALANYSVAVWHSGGVGTLDEQGKMFRGQNAIGGGSTVFLRAINLSILMGYGNQHYFGFDSCLDDGASHAYPADDDVMKYNMERVIDIRVPGSNRIFFCVPYMAAQAEQFQGLFKRQSHLFTPTVHGNGLIAEIMRQGARIQQERQNADAAD